MKYEKLMLFKYCMVECREDSGSQAVWLLRHLPRLQAVCGSSHQDFFCI